MRMCWIYCCRTFRALIIITTYCASVTIRTVIECAITYTTVEKTFLVRRIHSRIDLKNNCLQLEKIYSNHLFVNYLGQS
jgi:hypothetical protein